MRKLFKNIENIIKNDPAWKLTKVQFFFGAKVADEFYDADEGIDSLTDSFLNAKTVKMYVANQSAEKTFYKTQGKHTDEAQIIVCDKKYEKNFTKAKKIEIEDNIYSAYEKATGKFNIRRLFGNIIVVTLYRS